MQKGTYIVRKWIAFVLDVLYPAKCIGCAKTGTLVCTDCQPVPLEEHRRVRALPGDSALSRAQGIYAFSGTTRKAIHELKYVYNRRMVEPLASLLKDQLPWNPEILVPVPAHAERIKQRGFNQAELLAVALGKLWQIPVLTDLHRTRVTEQQVGRSAYQRVANVKGAFAWHGKALPERVLVIDDVLTTGATLNACAEALIEAGAVEVQGLTIARTL